MKNQNFKLTIILYPLMFSLSELIQASESLNISYVDFSNYDKKIDAMRKI